MLLLLLPLLLSLWNDLKDGLLPCKSHGTLEAPASCFWKEERIFGRPPEKLLVPYAREPSRVNKNGKNEFWDCCCCFYSFPLSWSFSSSCRAHFPSTPLCHLDGIKLSSIHLALLPILVVYGQALPRRSTTDALVTRCRHPGIRRPHPRLVVVVC